ncbi:hypothetical protein [Cyanobium sp. WAJ14-Wanaka]|uniref:hypothetical protein n=1 Tax=Cyanobium sp. WAJ14-Wanaka TaxID=2823725 RepID=UPI0020CC2D9D|nr:hypothetical protein [Cyanobium sp. WAJ14-Wanaka]MCP9776111.1 hypothetical protein [Cyanobium sp. WAJ14-Wanaka]
MNRLSALAAALLVGAASASVPHARAGMIDNIINSKCQSAMKADLAAKGITPPAGLVDSTCSCVVKQYNQGVSIDQSKVTCSQQAKAQLAPQATPQPASQPAAAK